MFGNCIIYDADMDAKFIDIVALLKWIDEYRPHMGDAQVLLKLIDELRKA